MSRLFAERFLLHRTNRNQTGFVIVWFSLFATVLLGFAGAAVDLGHVYLRMSRSQNAADAAALAGAPFLPASPELAMAAAHDVLVRNGVPDMKIVLNKPDETKSEYMHIAVSDTVPTTFLKMVSVDKFDYQRTAYAAMQQPIEMGSPDNTLGTQRGTPSWSVSGTPMEFWLSQNTWGHPKQNADRWTTPICSDKTDYCNNKAPKGTVNGVPIANQEFIPGGREFIVEVQEGATGYLAVDGYDLAMHKSASQADPNDNAYTGAVVDTKVSFFAPGASGKSGSPVSGCPTITVAGTDVKGGPALSWQRVCTVYIDGIINKAGRYHLFIDMSNSNTTDGTNSYSLRAGFLTSPTATTIDMVKSQKVKVFAPGKMVTRHDKSVTAKYYIARIPSALAAQTVQFQVFDFGETGLQQVKINWANDGSEPSNCRMSMPTKGWALDPKGGACTFDTSSVYSTFEKRVISVDIPIPKDYTCVPVDLQSCWLQVTADYIDDSNQEGASFSVEGVGNPLRLYNDAK